MVLKGCVAVGHGRVASVPGLGEEAEVREPKAADQVRTDPPLLDRLVPLRMSMDDHGQE